MTSNSTMKKLSVILYYPPTMSEREIKDYIHKRINGDKIRSPRSHMRVVKSNREPTQ